MFLSRKTRLIARLWIMLTLVTVGISDGLARAEDTDRLRDCLLSADAAADAVRRRDANAAAQPAPAKTATSSRVHRDALATVSFDPPNLTPKQASDAAFQACFEGE